LSSKIGPAEPAIKKFYSLHGQKIRYLLVGGWNTVFGYLLFAVLFSLLGAWVNYIAILVISYVFGITNAYLCYKFLVFRTEGNYLREYLRFYLVYGAAFLLNLALLPVFVELLHLDPLISQGIIVGLTVIISYIAHKNFSFSVRPDGLEGDRRVQVCEIDGAEDDHAGSRTGGQKSLDR